MSSQKPKKQLNNYAKFSGIAIQMFVIIGVGSYIGVQLDAKFPNSYNAYTISLALISVIMAIVFVIRRIISSSKDNE